MLLLEPLKCGFSHFVTGEGVQRRPRGIQWEEQGKSTADYKINGGLLYKLYVCLLIMEA